MPSMHDVVVPSRLVPCMLHARRQGKESTCLCLLTAPAKTSGILFNNSSQGQVQLNIIIQHMLWLTIR